MEDVEMTLSMTGAPVADVSVSMEIDIAALREDPAQHIKEVAKRLGDHLVEAFRLATPDMSENDTN